MYEMNLRRKYCLGHVVVKKRIYNAYFVRAVAKKRSPSLRSHSLTRSYLHTYLAFLLLEPSVKWSWNRWPRQTVAQLIQAKLAFGSFTKLTQRLFWGS